MIYKYIVDVETTNRADFMKGLKVINPDIIAKYETSKNNSYVTVSISIERVSNNLPEKLRVVQDIKKYLKDHRQEVINQAFISLG